MSRSEFFYIRFIKLQTMRRVHINVLESSQLYLISPGMECDEVTLNVSGDGTAMRLGELAGN